MIVGSADQREADAMVGVRLDLIKAHIIHAALPAIGFAVKATVIGKLSAAIGGQIGGGKQTSATEFVRIVTGKIECIFFTGSEAVDDQVSRAVTGEIEGGRPEQAQTRAAPWIDAARIAGETNGGRLSKRVQQRGFCQASKPMLRLKANARSKTE